MPPIEFEHRSDWAIGLKPSKRKITIKPDDAWVPIAVSHDVRLQIRCNRNDREGEIIIADCSWELTTLSEEEGSRHINPNPLIDHISLIKGNTVVLKRAGRKLAEIKFTPPEK